MTPYKPGFCAGCGTQIWITDSLGRLVRPMPILREGYLVFNNPTQYLKIPLCVDCENQANSETIQDYFSNIIAGNEGRDFVGRSPETYSPFELHWEEKGITVRGIWRMVSSQDIERVNNG